jgi:glycosyltransferase involved in cell wall biosynthesis
LTELASFNDEIQPRTKNKPLISLVIAAYNEEEGIAPTITEYKKIISEAQIIVVDGNSSDRTIELSEKLGAEILIQDSKGKGDAVAKGLSYLNDDTSYVIFTDADYTYPANHLNKMIKVLNNDPKVGMVLGNRFNEIYKNQSDRNQFYLGNRILGFAHRLFNGVDLNDPFTGLRIMRYDLVKNWTPNSMGFDIEAELNHHILKKGYEIVEIPIKYRKRLGKKKLGFKHGLSILRRIILQNFNISFN